MIIQGKSADTKATVPWSKKFAFWPTTIEVVNGIATKVFWQWYEYRAYDVERVNEFEPMSYEEFRLPGSDKIYTIPGPSLFMSLG